MCLSLITYNQSEEVKAARTGWKIFRIDGNQNLFFANYGHPETFRSSSSRKVKTNKWLVSFKYRKINVTDSTQTYFPCFHVYLEKPLHDDSNLYYKVVPVKFKLPIAYGIEDTQNRYKIRKNIVIVARMLYVEG